MADQPTAPLLLDVARSTLLELLPQVDAAHHYTLRMLANALAIAGRELAAANTATTEREALRLRAALHEGPARNAATRRELHAALRALTRARLAISNPRLLAATTRGDRS